MQEADKLLEQAEHQRTLGNHLAAKSQAVKVLQATQNGGWNVWGNLSDSAQRAKSMLVEEETSAANVIRYYAPLIEAERYVSKWIPVQHLVGTVGPLLNVTESDRLLDAVIDHVHLMVGNAAQEIQIFNFLADDAPEQSPAVELFLFIVWLCDHPQFLRRDRAAAMLLWLVEQLPDLFSIAATTGFSMEEGYGPDVLCGVLDGASAREPSAVWDKITGAVDLAKVTQELKHVSRAAVLLRMATRAAEAGSSSAKSAIGQIQASFTGHRGTAGNTKLPPWANCLAYEWRKLEDLVDSDANAEWVKELERLCGSLTVADVRALERAVSKSFRESPERPHNRWESKLRHSLNLALWRHVSAKEAGAVEAILRIYNPSQPERTVEGMSNPLTDQLMAAIQSGDFSAVLGSNATVLLNYHGVATKADLNGACHVEVLCLLQPTSNLMRFSTPKLDQFFRSSELPVFSVVNMPFETCCRLEPQVVFFGAFTPAIPLPFFRKLAGAKDNDFVRQNWRYSRRNGVRGLGQPEREGCSLSVVRKALMIPPGFKLAWIIWLDGEVVAFVDEHNNRLN